jgi:ureidoglycolate hydrolase
MEKIQRFDPKNFRNYGKIIGYPNKSAKGNKRNLWKIVHSENARTGWRIAYLVLRDKTIGRMECHPDSDETFEPVAGRALIFVSLTKNLEDIRCFQLDKPVILNKGVWHGLITVSDETEIKITENHEVKCLYWPLGSRITGLHDIQKKIDTINPA